MMEVMTGHARRPYYRLCKSLQCNDIGRALRCSNSGAQSILQACRAIPKDAAGQGISESASIAEMVVFSYVLQGLLCLCQGFARIAFAMSPKSFCWQHCRLCLLSSCPARHKYDCILGQCKAHCPEHLEDQAKISLLLSSQHDLLHPVSVTQGSAATLANDSTCSCT